jgi:antitoxin component YwqK of YwqJK toxin-antitoxin module
MKKKLIKILVVFAITVVTLISFKFIYKIHDDHTKISLGSDGRIYIAGTDQLYNGIITDTANVIIEFAVVNGVKNGSFRTYFLNGQIEKEGFIKNNKNVGEWKYYYENGQIETMGYFHENIPYGQWKSYYKNGNLKTIGIYRWGKQQGAWEEYYQDGKLANIFYYIEGKLKGQAFSNI